MSIYAKCTFNFEETRMKDQSIIDITFLIRKRFCDRILKEFYSVIQLKTNIIKILVMSSLIHFVFSISLRLSLKQKG